MPSPTATGSLLWYSIFFAGLIVPIFSNRVVEMFNTAADQAYASYSQAIVGMAQAVV